MTDVSLTRVRGCLVRTDPWGLVAAYLQLYKLDAVANRPLHTRATISSYIIARLHGYSRAFLIIQHELLHRFNAQVPLGSNEYLASMTDILFVFTSYIKWVVKICNIER